jgi:hypothetical protein
MASVPAGLGTVLPVHSQDASRNTRPHPVEDYHQAIAAVAALPCDMLITPQPGASDFPKQTAKRQQGSQPNPLIGTQTCKACTAHASVKLDAHLAKEKAKSPHWRARSITLP